MASSGETCDETRVLASARGQVRRDSTGTPDLPTQPQGLLGRVVAPMVGLLDRGEDYLVTLNFEIDVEALAQFGLQCDNLLPFLA